MADPGICNGGAAEDGAAEDEAPRGWGVGRGVPSPPGEVSGEEAGPPPQKIFLNLVR